MADGLKTAITHKCVINLTSNYHLISIQRFVNYLIGFGTIIAHIVHVGGE